MMCNRNNRPRWSAGPGWPNRTLRAATLAAVAVVGLASAALLAQGALPGTVTNLRLTPADTRITADWRSPTTGSPPAGYVVYWSPFSGRSSAQLETSVTRYTIEGLTNGTEYTVSVAATDAQGNSSGLRQAKATPSRGVAIDGYDVYVAFGTNAEAAETPAAIHAAASRALGDRSAAYWFFSADNPEVFVKVLNGCGANGHHWAYVATLTTLEYSVTIVRRTDGASKTYRGAANEGPWTHSDGQAFPCAE